MIDILAGGKFAACFFCKKNPIKNSFFWKIKHIVYVTKKSFGKKEKKW